MKLLNSLILKSTVCPFLKNGSFNITGCIIATLYGGACVFLILIASFMEDLTGNVLNQCNWTVVTAAVICPLTWFGTPKDFW